MAMFVYQRVNGLHIFGNHPEIWVSQLLSLGLLRRPTALEGQTWCAWLNYGEFVAQKRCFLWPLNDYKGNQVIKWMQWGGLSCMSYGGIKYQQS